MKTFLNTISAIFIIIFCILFVSCSNNITKIGDGIDSKYAGKYSAEINRKHQNGNIEQARATFTINNDGSLTGLITYYGGSPSEKIELSKENIMKIADNSYSAEQNFIGLKKYTFTFNNNTLELNIVNEDNSVTSGQLIKSN
ncbi:hypothetical protein [Brachyspira hampsonii]|uniref:Uncharacterized protein n=1 Tax=Brachyspira hampsonii TaxID=1287055 RepID=A0AAC9XKM7_9SPIR|nr:hypothetical protein [Brachyspira hampsonii]ASJ21626.1 hypothetical protein BHAMNSH16_08220 [Brachyspira hampsonii]ELV05216.1 hypothetical protein H263_11577 [Brachyspira hampsonii 30599]MBW5379142.1 hypothetical protein [Brachyspira hampsonii]MBW5409558.1 hypothetical protein [Brachyspira hampsonii]OEJ12885.1 hypothetical protein A9496_02795 [Brachyspira hampsonii]